LKPELVVTDDPAGAAAERLVAAAGGQVALAGGSTPKATYERVAGLGVDWSSTGFWFGDDRAVPPDHEHSNYRMAREALLDHVEPGAVHRIEGELGYEEAADEYERELREAFGDDPPALDLILLGLGPDAHTASLFPGDAALGERERWAVGVETPGMAPLVPRVTLTLPALNAGREVVFLVAGEDKADAVARAFSGAPDPGAPASLVAPDQGSLVVLLDPPAAARLEGVR
jgi:6-phosphogluconolactonase